MRTVLILANSTMGFYRFRKELVSSFTSLGEVFLASPDDGFVDEITALGAKYINTPFDRRGMNPFRDLRLFFCYKSLIKQTKPDIILTYTVKPNIYGNFAAKRFKVPVIATMTGLGDSFSSKGIVSRLVHFLYRTAFKKTSAITFYNQEDEDIFRSAGIIKNQKLLRVPGSGVNLSEYDELDYPISNDENDSVKFLFIGRVLRSKGIPELLEAARRLKTEYANKFELTLIGPHEGDVRTIVIDAEKNGLIRHFGFQKDIRPWVKDAHCIVLPSHYEGMGTALQEAAAMGRPLISTNTSGPRETVKNGINGFLCKPKDSDSLYECMKKFIDLSSENKLKMGKASRSRAETHFNRNIVINAVTAEIDRLLKEVIG